MSGAVVSRPGAQMQSFHVDGRKPGLFTLSIPLVDVADESDGTQFWPGSHLDGNSLSQIQTITDDSSEVMNAMQSPGCNAGSLLSFDYRIVHRGRPNKTRERPMAYAVIATDPNAWDAHNFSRLSVFDVLPIQIEQMDRFEDWL